LFFLGSLGGWRFGAFRPSVKTGAFLKCGAAAGRKHRQRGTKAKATHTVGYPETGLAGHEDRPDEGPNPDQNKDARP